MQAIHRLTPWHFSLLLFAVALGVCLVLVVLGFRTEKENTVTVHVWVPDNAASMHDLFGAYLRLGPSYNDAIPWKDTHTFGEFQELDAAINFFVLVDSQIKYLAVLRNADGTVSVARMTVSSEIPAKGSWETRVVSFDPTTGGVTAQYARNFVMIVLSGVLPILTWMFVTAVMALARVRWNEPVFSVRRAPA